MFYQACSGRGRGCNCCRMYILSLLLNAVPQELKNELPPPPAHSFTYSWKNELLLRQCRHQYPSTHRSSSSPLPQIPTKREPPHQLCMRRTPMAIRGVGLLDMDFNKEFTFEFAVQTHGSTKLNVMYTNDPDTVKLCLAKFKQYPREEKAQDRGTRPCAHPFIC